MIISYRRRGTIYAQYLSGEEVLGLRRAERRKAYLPVSSFPGAGRLILNGCERNKFKLNE
jgi:hypothetical protein